MSRHNRYAWHARQRRTGLAAVGVLWAAGIGFGVAWLLRYANTPGLAGAAVVSWPSDANVEAAHGRARLLMFVHPRCPCSRASVEELTKIVGRTRGRVDATVVFLRPSGGDVAWDDTELWRSASGIEGVRVVSDNDGIEATKFGAATSGHVVLYDASGRLLFAGGITSSRGHAGDNDGADAVVALVNGGKDAARVPTSAATAFPVQSPVFGCALGNVPCNAKSKGIER